MRRPTPRGVRYLAACRGAWVGRVSISCALLVIVSLVPATAAKAGPPGSGFRSCGSYRDHGARFLLYGKHVGCRRARQIQRAYERGAPSTERGWDELCFKNLPGWCCGGGGGSVTCRKGRSVSASVAAPSPSDLRRHADRRRRGGRITLGVRGVEGPAGRGWGRVRPKLIFNGGDANGLVDGIHWRHWGSSAAIGVGRNSIFRPHGGYYSKRVRIVLRASRPRRCAPGARHRSYSRLAFRVPRRPGGPLPRHWTVWNSDMCHRLEPYLLDRHASLPKVEDGTHFTVRPPRMSGWTGDGSQVLGGPSSEPPVGYYPGGSFGRIDWRAWTHRRAHGRGVLWADDCEPDCGSGTWEAFPTRVHLRRVRHGRFTRMEFACDCFGRKGYHELFKYRDPYPPQWWFVRGWRSGGG